MSDSCRDRSLGNACLLKLAEEHPENLSYLTTPLRDPIRNEADAGTHTTYASLTTTDKNRHAQDDMHDMAAMVQCNLSILIGVGTPNKQIKVGVAFLPTKLNVD